jgi:hypothetical protein
MVDSLYKNDFRATFTPGKNLPKVSTQLDSVRAYMFEVRFYGLPQNIAGSQQDLTLAAKQVSQAGISVEPIEARRLNDKYWFPGQVNQDELTITFDDLYLKNTTPTLWEWFKAATYDPLTGDMSKIAAPGGPGNRTFKATKLVVLQLDNTRNPIASQEYYGVWPMSWKPSEKNSTTNEFATVEVSFKFDLLNYERTSLTNQL